MTTEIEERMKDFHLVELEGKCFFQHKARKSVMVCANCVEDGKRYYLEYNVVQSPEKPHSLECRRCKAHFYLSVSPENAELVSGNQ